MPAMPRDEERYTYQRIVSLVVQKLEIPADKAWEMTVADLCLTLQEPEEQSRTATNQLEQYVILAELDERITLMKNLTVAQRIELADWKFRLM